MLALKLRPGGFFQIETARGETIRVHVMDSTDAGVCIGVDAPDDMDVARDKVLAKRAAARQPKFGTGAEALEANHLRD